MRPLDGLIRPEGRADAPRITATGLINRLFSAGAKTRLCIAKQNSPPTPVLRCAAALRVQCTRPLPVSAI